MQVISLSAAEAGSSRRALELVKGFAFLCEGWPGADPAREAEDWLRGLPGDARVWALSASGGWRWLLAWQPLAFDSKVFGRGLGRLCLLAHHQKWPQSKAREQGRRLLAELVADAWGEGVEGLWARVPARDLLSAQALEACGFKLYDPGVEWEMDLAALPAPPPDEGAKVRPWRKEDQKPLLDLASRAFCQREDYADRFALDPRLREGCPSLYRRWMANSLAGSQADQVLVLEQGGWAQGFITLRKAPGGEGPKGACGWVVLNAISPVLRGKGHYHRLLWAGLAWLRAQGALRARVRTKASQGAVIRAWARLGARPAGADLTFHYWMEQS